MSLNFTVSESGYTPKLAMRKQNAIARQAAYDIGEYWHDSYREKQRETEDLVTRYTEAYAAVAADDLPSDDAAPTQTAPPT